MTDAFVVIENGELIKASNADAIVPWWSFGKTVIAAAALALVQEKRLALDAPLADRRYTLRQLLQHRAGLTDYGALAAYHAAVEAGDAPWPVALLLERTDAQRLRYQPGHDWGYSNIGYLFVRELIERTCGLALGDAIAKLVLRPLRISNVRLARDPADLKDVHMGVPSYHPGWVYHGLLVGPLREAALLLDRLMRGALLGRELLAQMGEPYWLDTTRATSREERPWRAPAYGLGVMCGVAANSRSVIGHTGGGPGSVVAVFHVRDAQPYTAAAFALGNAVAEVERQAMTGRG
ncbi:MAG TPA: serine hydrolase domain-containing protein [Acetobacteraceae bacterium]|nr:serine hydrolase domain-containing protein [Acetobacteraceae bacterium]